MLSTFPTSVASPRNANYQAVGNLTQYKGISPFDPSMTEAFFKLDQNNVPVQYFDGVEWKPFTIFLASSLQMLITNPAIDKKDSEELAFSLAASGMFKVKTDYLRVGDENIGQEAAQYAPATIDLKTMLAEEEYKILKQYMTFMPRSMLWDFFMKKIWPTLPEGQVVRRVAMSGPMHGPMRSNQGHPQRPASLAVSARQSRANAGPKVSRGRWSALSGMGSAVEISYSRVTSIYGDSHVKKPFEVLIWAAFVDLFNLANLEYINKNQISPETWEEQKLEAYYVSSSQDSIADLGAQIDQYSNDALALDPRAVELLKQFELLPKLGDTGMEINRQNAVRELLKMQDYDSVQVILDTFRYLNGTPDIGPLLTKPFASDIVTSDGVVMAKATNTQGA